MAIRFYLPRTGFTADISPAFDSNWTVTGSADRQMMYTTKQSTSWSALQRTNGSTATPVSRLLRQYVSEAIEAGPITGTAHGVTRWNEDNGANNANTNCVLKVVSGDGSTVRGILIARDTNGFDSGREFSAQSGSNGSRWFFPKSVAQRTMTTVVAQQGDRLVLEIGYTAFPGTGNANRWGEAYLGDGFASDLPESEGSGGGTSLNAWFDIDTDVFVPRGQGRSFAVVVG